MQFKKNGVIKFAFLIIIFLAVGIALLRYSNIFGNKHTISGTFVSAEIGGDEFGYLY